MELVPGEYEFTCDECDGEGSVFTGVEAEGPSWVRCDDCRGEGRLLVDEEEAAEKIRWGQTPTRTPAAT
jgi:DnaJ-class molecular chaperone